MWSRAGFAEFSHFCSSFQVMINAEYIFSFDYAGILTAAICDGNKSNSFKSCIFMLENIEYMIKSHGMDSLDVLASIWEKSTIIYPEINRLNLDVSTYSKKLPLNKNLYVLSPTSPISINKAAHKNFEVNGKICSFIYAGSIVEESFALEFGRCLNTSGLNYAYDLYGPVGKDYEKHLSQLIEESCGKVKYLGIVNQYELNQVYSNYDYSFTGWKPISSNYYFACPNKFFQSIRNKVIPVTLDHPIIRNTIDSFGLFTIRLPWEQHLWADALSSSIFSKKELSQHTELNYKLFKENLSWEVQFGNLKNFLEC
jgi:hypothetical protein